MSMLVRGGRNALGLGATIAAVLLLGTVCSVDNAGLSGASGGAGAAGKGNGGSGGSAGHTGGRGGGTAGTGSGGILGSGGTIVLGSGGRGGTGGLVGTGGAATGGTVGTGGAATGGTVGTGGSVVIGTGGTTGAGGVAGSGSGGAAGAAGSGGMNGTGGSAGAAGNPATGGMGGHGGGGGRPPSCASFPSGTSLTTSADGRLHCYWVHGSQIDWNSAETVCENEGGTLVTILSETENATVVQLASQANLFMGIGMTGQVFIGATDGRALDDRNGAGDYAWVTGEPWGYENWHTGQPDGACTSCSGPGPNSGCACDHRGAITVDGTWYDRTQTTTRPFVCEAIAP